MTYPIRTSFGLVAAISVGTLNSAHCACDSLTDNRKRVASRALVQRSLFLPATMTSVQAVLSALDVFSRAPEKAALDQANTWLQDFQHSVNTLSPGTSEDRDI